jgi:uncharacterized protein YdeI (YjbR/CyaY-like superfamily)
MKENMNPDVDAYLSKVKYWNEEATVLRSLLIECGLTEAFKWRAPCYMFQDSNIVILHLFKDYCALGFFKGVLLHDIHEILSSPGENSQSVRMAKFTSVKDIKKQKAILKAYIFEAIEVEKAGLKVELKQSKNLELTEEFQHKLDHHPALKKAFEALTPGRQRAYHLYFSAPKQSATRITRVEKYVSQILCGKGINDCTCGFSKKMPQCDGSHKHIKS